VQRPHPRRLCCCPSFATHPIGCGTWRGAIGKAGRQVNRG
jgi:hypothetical protein